MEFKLVKTKVLSKIPGMNKFKKMKWWAIINCLESQTLIIPRRRCSADKWHCRRCSCVYEWTFLDKSQFLSINQSTSEDLTKWLRKMKSDLMALARCLKTIYKSTMTAQQMNNIQCGVVVALVFLQLEGFPGMNEFKKFIRIIEFYNFYCKCG